MRPMVTLTGDATLERVLVSERKTSLEDERRDVWRCDQRVIVNVRLQAVDVGEETDVKRV